MTDPIEYLLAGLLVAAAVAWAWHVKRGSALYPLAAVIAIGAIADTAGYGLRSESSYSWGATAFLALSGLIIERGLFRA